MGVFQDANIIVPCLEDKKGRGLESERLEYTLGETSGRKKPIEESQQALIPHGE
jgi:hypothetical protein